MTEFLKKLIFEWTIITLASDKISVWAKNVQQKNAF